MDAEIQAKIDRINRLIKEAREYKEANPSERLGYWLDFGSLLNAYREGDIAFADAVALMETKVRSRRYCELLLLLDKLARNLSVANLSEAVCYLEMHKDDVEAARILTGGLKSADDNRT